MKLESSRARAQKLSPDPRISDAIEVITPALVETTVRDMAYPRDFSSEPASNRRAGDYIADRLRTAGFDIRLQGPYRNVIALPRGLLSAGNASPSVTLVGAHYDTVAGSPGADDNGSAVSAMIACAEVTARSLPPEAPVCFVAFNCEEVQPNGRGLVGSTEFVESFLPTSVVSVRAAHVLEMVGYASSAAGSQQTPDGLPVRLPDPGNWLGLVGNAHSAALVVSALDNARTYAQDIDVLGLSLPPFAEKLLPVLARSDHAPFWRAGIPALQWTDTAEFRNRHYHGAADVPETLDFQFLAAVARLITACVLGDACA